MQFLSITAYALDGFAFAAESLVGQAMGARAPARVLRASKVTGLWGGAGAVLLGLGFYLLGPMIIDVMTTAPDVRELARVYLPWVAIAPVIGIASWMLDGVFIGATLTREMRNAMVVSFPLFRRRRARRDRCLLTKNSRRNCKIKHSIL